MIPQKIPLLKKIIIKIKQKIDKFKEKYKKSNELRAFVQMKLDILLTGILLYLGYLSFTTPYWYFKVLGFGSLFWLIKEKVVDGIVRILSSFKIISINR